MAKNDELFLQPDDYYLELFYEYSPRMTNYFYNHENYELLIQKITNYLLLEGRL